MTLQVTPTRKIPPAPGEINGTCLYRATEACRRLGWGAKGYRKAKRDGLRFIRYGRIKYILGEDLLAFFQELARKQGTT